MKKLIILLLILLAVLQYKLWFSPGGIWEARSLKKQITKLQYKNDRLQQRNAIMLAEVNALKTQNSAVETRAREDLGMVKKGEVFYRVVS